jgi:quercetin dioxygenase-like cupin family protein/tetratricopeptide (TPR) repeat protein
MKITVLTALLSGLAAFTAITRASAPEQPGNQAVTRTDLGKHLLSSGDFRDVQAAVIALAPGAAAPRHRHNAAVLAYVLEGKVENQFDGRPVQTHETGDSWWEDAGTVHEVARNASNKAPARLLVVYIGEQGKAQTVPVDTPDEHANSPVNFRVSCSTEAQIEFNRGVALLHHMTYPSARESFRRTAQIDPACAMASWGIAMTLFQPLWPTRPSPAELRQGWELLQTPTAQDHMSERERLFLAAATAFFREPESPDYWERIRRWEASMAKAYAAYPQDQEVAAFFALAHLAAAPPDDRSVISHSQRAAEILTAIHRENPVHPGALHYLVHASDAPGRERESLDIVRDYEASAPRNPHALHMPTHIYTRLGEWSGVIRGNLLAAQAALEFPAGDHGQYVSDEFPHAIEYLVYAYLQTGADEDAAAQVNRLQATPKLQPTLKTAFHLASTRARFALERRAWGEARSLTPRERPELDWNRYAWPEAVTWFAKGMGAVHEGAIEEARAAADKLGVLGSGARSAGEDLFARNIRVLELELQAWMAQAQGNTQSSRERMREAAELERTTPKHAVTPAPTLPAHELWGDLLLEQRGGAEALAQYRTSLDLYPRRFNSVLGAARAAVAAGEMQAARDFYSNLLALAASPGRSAVLDEARRFVTP